MSTPRPNPEIVLQKEHAAREVQRASLFVLNVILAAIVRAAAAAPQEITAGG